MSKTSLCRRKHHKHNYEGLNAVENLHYSQNAYQFEISGLVGLDKTKFLTLGAWYNKGLRFFCGHKALAKGRCAPQTALPTKQWLPALVQFSHI